MQTFRAATIAECISQVKRELGTDAVILHTRSIQRRVWLGLRRIELVEITASRDVRVAPRHPRPSVENGRGADLAKMRLTDRAPERRLTAGYDRTSTAATATAAAAQAPGQALLQSSAVSNVALVNLNREMDSIKSMIKELSQQVRHGGAANQVPEELFDHYMCLIQNQVADELAGEIMENIRKSCRPEHFGQSEFIREKIAEQLERLVPVAGPISRQKLTGPHVVALIGPTGVGKTTTVAKLAANLKLREKRKVGLITIDTYRIAAIDQLKRYADILGAPLRVAGSAEDIRAAIASMNDCEFILIDTAGRSPNDTLKLNELKTFIDSAGVDEVHLVLSTTASQACVELAVEQFSKVRVDKVIFTKIDEAAHLGVVLNVVRKMNKSLSYITNGQDVPDDIEVGRGRKLAQLILGGGK